MFRKIFLGTTLLALVFTISVSARMQSRAKVIPNAYIVQVADADDVHEVAGKVARFSGGGIGHIYTHALWGFSIQVPPGITKAQILARAGVVLVEPDLEVHICQQTLPTGVDRIDVDKNATAKIDGIDERVDVDIAIIDTGIDTDHPDLNVVGGRRFYTIATGPPWQRGSFDDDNYDDDSGHGSHVAGTAAAIDNDSGVVGVAPGARLWAVKVLDASGSGYLSDVIAGVDWVTQNANQIEVANMSLSATGKSDTFRIAIQNSVAAGVVHVVAAGNDSTDIYGNDGTFNTNDDIIPAAYPEVATISAMADSDGQPGGAGGNTSYGQDDSFATFSNFSHGVVGGNPVFSPGAAIDLLLPGVDIYSTYKDGGYATGSGTSMASPHAAGLVALYIAANDRATAAAGVYAIRQVLIDGGVAQTSPQGLTQLTDPDVNWENIGWGDTEPTGPQPPIANAGPDQTVSDADGGGSEIVTLDGSGSSDADGTIESYEWDTNGDGLTDLQGVTVDTMFAVGSHTVTLTVTDNDELTDTDDVIITVNQNQTPVANAGEDQTITDADNDGVETVRLDGSVSFDADGTIQLYEWDTNGDGLTDIEGVIVDTVFAVGSHAVVLKVTDNGGATDTDEVIITVTEAGGATAIHVASIEMSPLSTRSAGRNIFMRAAATVTIIDASDNPVEGATVYGSWSGATSDTDSGVTDATGNVTLESDQVKNAPSGTIFTFTVTDVSKSGWDYDSESNVETSDSTPVP